MDNNYFDFLRLDSIPSNEKSNTNDIDKNMVSLTIRADVDCQVFCDGDFFICANAKQPVKKHITAGQHLIYFTPVDCPNVTVEKIVDFPEKGKNYLIVMNELKEKVVNFQIEAEEQAREQAEKKREYEKTHNIEFSVNGIPFQMIYINGGTYEFGQGGDCVEDIKKVSVKDFHIGKNVVTQGLWKAVMGSEAMYDGGWTEKYGRDDDFPAYNVTWHDCQKFIGKLNAMTNRKFRLPTVVEWEYAARGGNQNHNFKFSGSDYANRVSWNRENSGKRIHRVGELEANELGLYDMSGNVEEWCEDLWDDFSDFMCWRKVVFLQDHNPERLTRGGSYCSVEECKVYYINSFDQERGLYDLGFRLALNV